jgi:hypothetical protein
LRDFKQIEGQESYDWSRLRIRKLNKTVRGFVGTIQAISSTIDNNWKVAIQLFKKQGGEYRKLPYNIAQQGFCDFVQHDEHFVPELTKAFKAPYPFPCPHPQVSLHSRLWLAIDH